MTKATYALVSLGCPKNLVDSECMAGLLRLEGYQLVPDPARADFVVINTCGFIGDARKESYGAIGEMLELKKRGLLRGVIVAGCLAERDRENLLKRYPQIDQLLGVFARDDIATAADRLLAGPVRQPMLFRPAPGCSLPETNRLRITPRHLAFLKISEGCNRLCSFCTIPRMRGPYVSKPMEQVVVEAGQLAADGVRELILIAQDTSFYGIDLYGGPRLDELLRRLDGLDGLAWIRVMYLYPMHITDELIDVLATAKKVVPYLDLPLQHVSDAVLRRMRRGITRLETQGLIDRLRRHIAGLVLRTTLMAGFPGETAEQFDELLQFVRQQRFERLGAFCYSREADTAAAALDGQLSRSVKRSRRDRLLAAQQEIAFAYNQQQVGRQRDVLIDRPVPEEQNAYVGRTYADAPEIDGVVYVTGEDLSAGQIVPCEIVAAKGYDLIGVGQS